MPSCITASAFWQQIIMIIMLHVGAGCETVVHEMQADKNIARSMIL